ncbi:MAG: hypothetical protein JXB88_18035 [Spirochaetales bacterium]|nr:hypothetical protein [Spirochaetales bacterium]
MKTNEKNPLFEAKERIVRYLKSRAYPVIPVTKTPDKKEKKRKDTKDLFIDQLKKSIKDPCIFIHFPKEKNRGN